MLLVSPGHQRGSSRTNIEMLYQLICDAKDNGHTYDELEEVTGLARGTLQNIVRGCSPKINF